ncbi:MAG: TonB-dependent receptor [Acidobacteria bacterium]|nr:MAG: TonB-dependent receptor [Acidobacteriota bacterium]
MDEATVDGRVGLERRTAAKERLMSGPQVDLSVMRGVEMMHLLPRGLGVVLRGLMLCLFLLFLSGRALAGYGSDGGSVPLKGTVRDSNGHALSGITVRLISEKGTVWTAVTDARGAFNFVIPPGRYRISIEVAGYEPFRQRVTVARERSPSLTIGLRPEIPKIVESMDVVATAPRTAASASTFRQQELALREIETPGDVLRVVPGLVIAQHAGGGKSDQYLIRGFDADHGTDFAIYIDGIPVNMVSHAHGQGYADLHFLIPETLERIDVYKGPYFAEYGNLATAGVAHLRLRDRFDHSFFRIQGGSFDTLRVLTGWSPDVSWTRGFLAVEGYRTDGPFLHAQNLRRLNLATRWAFPVSADQQLTALFTGYRGAWNASGQIPLREVRAGRLDRFGAIDPSEGGRSSRYNLSLAHIKQWARQSLKSQFYVVRYDLDLYSDFTFFLRDPVNGDGILQSDDRTLFGGHVQLFSAHRFLGRQGVLTLGLDYREDHARVGLFHQRQRHVLATVADSDIDERNVGLYVQEEIPLHRHAKALVGLRYDRFHFAVRDRIGDGPHGRETRSIVLPKASLILTPLKDETFQVFLNYGRGFHSNDARSVVADPRGVALAAADGYEIGVSKRWGRRLEVNFAYWLLDLEGELVWVGDEGVTELRGPTRRYGPELEVHWRINEYLWANFDVTHATGFFRGTKETIPRAPRWTYAGGLTFVHPCGFSGSFRWRGIGDFPLNEEGTFRGDGYLVADLTVKQRLRKWLDVVASFENLFDAEFKEAQTFFASRLPFEAEPVADNHFTPGNPFTFRIGLQFSVEF